MSKLLNHKRVLAFIEKWQPIFARNTMEGENPDFVEDCWALGFEMDCGRSLAKAYPNDDINSVETFRIISENITDIHSLGTAIFSMWRYRTHWCDYAGGGLNEESCAWLDIAFQRLRVLAENGKAVSRIFSTKQLQRFRGMLWGLVVGDCLGSPIQFMVKDDHPYITEMVPCENFHTPAGYWTHDSSMAFCIMESVARLGKYDLADIGNNFVRWLNDGFWSSLPHAFDVGGATRYTVREIAQGSLCNGREESQGNGSIMRFAPAYLLNYGNEDDTILYAVNDLTHYSKAVHKVVDRMKRVCDDHLAGKRTKITSPYKTREEVNNSGWSVSTLDAALWAFHTTKSFEDGMIAAVNLGGDADSIGAVYGQIAGAYYGIDAIPKRWIEAVKDKKRVSELIENFLKEI